ncbi:MAG: DUF1573 domain-containing protein [Spirochaetales bacterium]|nr:DUF1573 domain-containing protein [Spirochaetales bacterium]
MTKRISFWIIITLAMMSFLIGCIQEKMPGIKFASRIYKFGEVIEGDRVSCSFTFMNPGTDTLEITEVKGTCGCTVPGEYTKTVAPGKTGEIPVVFNSYGYEGEVTKTIKVSTNIPESEPINLTLEGKIRVILKITPRDIWLGQVRKDSLPLTGSVNIKNHVSTPLKILKAYPSGENCTVNVNTITQGEEYEIVVTVGPPFKMEQAMEILTIETNIEGKEKIEIKYHYYGVPDIEVYPQEIILYREHLQPDTTWIITVRNHLDTLIEIINPRLHGQNMEYQIEKIEPDIQIFIIFKKGFTFPKDDTFAFTFEVKYASGKQSFTIPIKNGED